MKKHIFAAALSLAIATYSVSAQEFATSYFLDNNVYAYRINPAIPGEKGFFGIGISNINLSFGSNAGLSSFLYPKQGGGLVTGFNSSVSADQFLSKLPKNCRADQVFNENLLSLGFFSKNAFHNIEINVKEDVFVGLPRDMFEMMKVGSSDYPYDLSQTNLSAKSYAEIAYGYTRKINDKFRVGGRVKFLVGLASGSFGFERGYVTLNGDQVSYDMLAKFRLSSNFLSAGFKSGTTDVFDFSAFNMGMDSISPCGWGGALDLGVTYKPLEDLTVSFSVLDFGGIKWNYNIVGTSTGSDSFTGETIKSDGTVKGDLEKFVENINNLADFRSVDGGESSFDMLSCTMHLGARYNMPFYKRLSAGLLMTCKIDKFNPSFTARLGATVTPIDWLSVTANIGRSTYCWTYGGALSINAASFNIIAGYEGYCGKVSDVKVSDILSPFVTPINSFQNMVKLGITLTFGKRYKQSEI